MKYAYLESRVCDDTKSYLHQKTEKYVSMDSGKFNTRGDTFGGKLTTGMSKKIPLWR